MEKGFCGAWIERGTAQDVAAGMACVRSIDRPGMESPPLPILCGEEIYAGDMVYYFLFPDGSGAIIAKIPE